MNTRDRKINVKTARDLVFVNMINDESPVKTVKGHTSANMIDRETDAKIVKDLVFVNMIDYALHAKPVRVHPSVNTEGRNIFVLTARAWVFVNMGAGNIVVSRVEEKIFAIMG